MINRCATRHIYAKFAAKSSIFRLFSAPLTREPAIYLFGTRRRFGLVEYHPAVLRSILKSTLTTSNEGLVRGIRRWDLVAVTINGIIGAGIFGLPSKVYGLIGSYSLIAFVVCALVVMLIILCFAEVGSRFDETGGPYLYARAAFGAAVGFEVGWLMWLARLTAFAANCNLLVDYLGFFWAPATMHYWREAIIVTVVAALAAVNVL